MRRGVACGVVVVVESQELSPERGEPQRADVP